MLPTATLTDTTGTLQATDGTPLFYRDWPVDRARACLVLVHGLGEHAGRYVHVADRLNGIGIAVRAADHRGHGKSSGKRGVLLRPDDLIHDLALVVEQYAKEQGTRPFLLGHSLGGLVAARVATGGYAQVRGLILSSPALRLRLPPFAADMLAYASFFMPSMVIDRGSWLRRISHDPSVLPAAESDPLNHRNVTAGLLYSMFPAMKQAYHDAASFDKPTLLLVAGDDHIVNPKGSLDFYGRLPNHIGTLRWYDTAYHEIFNETSELRTRVLNDLCEWIELQLSQ